MDEIHPSQNVPSPNVQVQPTTNVSRARSRIGFAFYVAVIALWVLAIIGAGLISAIFGNLIGYAKGDFGTTLVMFIALAVPLLPLFLFSNNQLQKMLVDPANFEDLSFKKSVRNSLFLALFFGTINIVVGIYGTLEPLVLSGKGSVAESLMHVIVYGGTFAGLAYYSWSFHKRTRS